MKGPGLCSDAVCLVGTNEDQAEHHSSIERLSELGKQFKMFLFIRRVINAISICHDDKN